MDANTVRVGDALYTADHIIIATGGTPRMPDVPGVEHTINSDGFFDMEDLPRRVLVVGAGYIAVEMAGILNALGSQVTLSIRHESVRSSHSMGNHHARLHSCGDTCTHTRTHTYIHVHTHTLYAHAHTHTYTHTHIHTYTHIRS